MATAKIQTVGEELIAIMDFIMAYPDEKTAFIGFFMTATSIQNTGIGSGIIDDLCRYMTEIGLSSVRLGWVIVEAVENR